MGGSLLLRSLLLFILMSLTVSQNCYNDKRVPGIIQYPKSILAEPGGSANISCSISSSNSITGVYLRKRNRRILYIYHDNTVTKEIGYENHLNLTGTVLNFTITLIDLTEDDTDIYVCDAAANEKNICGDDTVLMVHAKAVAMPSDQNVNLPTLIYSAIITVFICLILLYICYMKRQSKSRMSPTQNIVYEDMTQTMRRNTMANSNCYT